MMAGVRGTDTDKREKKENQRRLVNIAKMA